MMTYGKTELMRQLEEFKAQCDALAAANAGLKHERDALRREYAKRREERDAILDMIRDREDRYGVGSMCSQWTGEEIADDIMERLGIAPSEDNQ